MIEANKDNTPEEIAEEIQSRVNALQNMGRNDLLLQAISIPVLEELRIQAARSTLSPLKISSDYRFILTNHNTEIELSPVHKAVYLLFLNHPEGIEFKRLTDYKKELLYLYKETTNISDLSKIEESVEHLINPFDNAINEKCSRIKKAFSDIMDEYSATYYIISGHVKRHVEGSSKIWYERLKVITLPRELVIWQK
ncbi:MAG TPA: hypothetical protein PLF38_06650 [Xylanibacter oryzae]|jgi:hypothetical protein|nr:hypothetical protein [Prevotella sp.]HRN16714.1 hypothetical protein [Xylanibacter oryzae]